MGRKLQLKIERLTARQFSLSNTTLQADQLGIETDTGKMKLGNGYSKWNSLAYFSGGMKFEQVGEISYEDLNQSDTVTFEGGKPLGKFPVAYLVYAEEGLVSYSGNTLSAMTFGASTIPPLSLDIAGSVLMAIGQSGSGGLVGNPPSDIQIMVARTNNVQDWTSGNLLVFVAFDSIPSSQILL